MIDIGPYGRGCAAYPTWEVQEMLGQVHKEWLRLPEDTGVKGTWVRLYNELSAEGIKCGSYQVPIRVWFIDRSGIRAKEVHDFARFEAVLIEQRWLPPWTFRRPSEQIFGRRHEIGLATIGPLSETPDWYLDFQWGHLFGHAYRYSVDSSTKSVSRVGGLWIS
jgi:hypothetical protein